MSRFDESNGIQITQLQADSRPAISCRLAHCPLPSFPQESCLIASFSGIIADSDTHEDGYPYMHAMIGSGFAACNPATLILDLRELPYESGDRMSKIIDQRLITKVIVSEVNRDALTRLIASVHFLDPKAELFESLPEALEACDSAYRRFLSAGLKKTMASDF